MLISIINDNDNNNDPEFRWTMNSFGVLRFAFWSSSRKNYARSVVDDHND